MEFADIYKDKLHNIDTEGRSEKYSDNDIFPYEPTPYSVLERLVDSGIIDEDSHVIDYGSGMGRACLYLAEKTGCRCTGIECVDEFYQASLKNLEDKNLRVDEITFFDEIDCTDLFDEDTTRNRIMIFHRQNHNLVL